MTKVIAGRYARVDKAGKGRVLDELCATTGWHRNHARKALKAALRPGIVKPQRPRPPKYGPKVLSALIFCWAVLGMPAGKRLAPVLGELVAICAGSVGWTSTTTPRRCWRGCRRPPSTAGWHQNARSTS